jgi:hypothetical protein
MNKTLTFLSSIIVCDESWVRYYDPVNTTEMFGNKKIQLLCRNFRRQHLEEK